MTNNELYDIHIKIHMRNFIGGGRQTEIWIRNTPCYKAERHALFKFHCREDNRK
jgi:hypothetical protein